MEPVPSPPRNEDRYLRWIAVLNLGKGLLFFLLAIGILGCLHQDVDGLVGSWMSVLGFNMENHHVVAFLAQLDKVTDRQLAQWSGITFAVSGVFTLEGAGLFFRQQWAKYLTVCVTASLIPVEIIESIKHFGWLKIELLAVNVGVVAFLLITLVNEKKRALQNPAAVPLPSRNSAVGF